MSVIKINEENFENEVLKSEKKVIVDFYADWCGPCQIMSPIIDEIAEELGENVKVCKVNSDENMNLLEQFGIMSIPTIIVFINGEVAKTFVGVAEKQKILESIN
ncbi:MAG: thioredoxin [Clostridia bacterium]|nr:thioredoxin [Clostridia bacterium]